MAPALQVDSLPLSHQGSPYKDHNPGLIARHVVGQTQAWGRSAGSQDCQVRIVELLPFPFVKNEKDGETVPDKEKQWGP